MVDKLWIAFQIISGLCQLHNENFYHGDLQPNSVVFTSWDWVFIVDFAPYKPIYLSSESLGDYQFFFSSDSKKMDACYLAPERFVPASSDIAAASNSATIKTKQAMDIFSLGCLLAELFLDGTKLFDLPKLQSYKNGKYHTVFHSCASHQGSAFGNIYNSLGYVVHLLKFRCTNTIQCRS